MNKGLVFGILASLAMATPAALLSPPLAFGRIGLLTGAIFVLIAIIGFSRLIGLQIMLGVAGASLMLYSNLLSERTLDSVTLGAHVFFACVLLVLFFTSGRRVAS